MEMDLSQKQKETSEAYNKANDAYTQAQWGESAAWQKRSINPEEYQRKVNALDRSLIDLVQADKIRDEAFTNKDFK
jgi:hypothetical protein